MPVVQYATSANASPYSVKGTGEGLCVGVCVAVDCGVEVAVGEVCSNEHDKRGNVKAIINMNILILKRILIGLLLIFFKRGQRYKRPALLECNPKIMQFYRA